LRTSARCTCTAPVIRLAAAAAGPEAVPHCNATGRQGGRSVLLFGQVAEALAGGQGVLRRAGWGWGRDTSLVRGAGCETMPLLCTGGSAALPSVWPGHPWPMSAAQPSRQDVCARERAGANAGRALTWRSAVAAGSTGSVAGAPQQEKHENRKPRPSPLLDSLSRCGWGGGTGWTANASARSPPGVDARATGDARRRMRARCCSSPGGAAPARQTPGSPQTGSCRCGGGGNAERWVPVLAAGPATLHARARARAAARRRCRLAPAPGRWIANDPYASPALPSRLSAAF
jgi:hypothetical protein